MQRYDHDKSVEAGLLQLENPSWVVMWGFYAKTYTAWYLGDPHECHSVDAETPDELRDRMKNAELDLWRASHVPHWQPTPKAAGEARQT